MAQSGIESDKRNENLRRRILIPLGLGLALLVAVFVLSVRHVQQQKIQDDVKTDLQSTRDLWQTELDEEAELQEVLLKTIQGRASLQTSWLSKDRSALLGQARPIYERLQSDHGITHFYFIDTNRVCFLRVHNPERFGDTIPRFTLNDAAHNQTEVHGVELGKFGTLTLRSVLPWHHDGRLIGYVELGQEVDLIVSELRDIIGVNLVTAVQKSYLDSAAWEEGNRMLGHTGSWDRFDNFVVVSSTTEELPEQLASYLAPVHSKHENMTFEATQSGRPCMGLPLRLVDAGNRDIGDILVLRDISADNSALTKLTATAVTAGIIVSALLFSLFYFILGRIQGALERARANWISEFAERKRVVEELAGHNDFLSNVFESLTHPFYVIDAKTYQIIMGNGPTGLLGQSTKVTCHEFTHHNAIPCSGANHVCPLMEARITKKPVTVEHIHYDSEGNERHVEVHGYPILDENGEVAQIIEYSLDITERKRIEKELMESRTHSRMIIETASDAYIAINSEGIVTDWNRRAEKMFGWLSKETMGKQLTELIIDKEMADLHRKALAHCVRTGQGPILNKRIEVTAQHRNGLSFPVELTVWATGKDTGVQFNAFISDITERKLAEAEIRKFKTIADNASYGVAIAGLDTKYVYTNDSFARMHGRTPDWFLGRQVLTTLTRESRKKAVETTRSLIEKGYVQPQEFWYRHRDGHEFPGLVSPVMIPDADGKPAFVAAVLVDISERKRAEEQVRESEEQFRNLFEQSNDAIFVHTADGRIIEANQRSSEMLGYDREKLLTLPIQALHPDSEKDTVERAYTTIRKQGSVQFQSKFRREDGSIVDVEVSSRILDENHGIIQGVVRDISERVRQERELRKLSAAVNQSGNLVCITDPAGTIEYANPQFCNSSGYSLQEVVGHKSNLLKSGYEPDELYRTLWQTIKAGGIWSGRIRDRRKNGEIFWAQQTITPILNDDGQIINYLSIIEDVSKDVATQNKLVEADKLAAIGTLAAGVAHEFKNYLAGILGNASYALSGLDDSDGMDLAREGLIQIVELGERANDVAMSLLTYSKAKPDEIALEDLRTIIENSIRLVEKEIRNQSIEILIHFEDLPKVRVSASKIQQVLLNLIINARHAIDSDGVITIGLVRQNDQALIKVSDTGKGIPAANLSRVFDPFYSTKGVWGKDAVSGTGMGLSICRNIAREHNGDLTVESVVGVGSTFVFSIPLSDAENCSDPSSSQASEQLRLLLFTADETLIADYQRQAGANDPVLQIVDDVETIGDDLDKVADAVICDASMTAKGKLHRMVEVCRKFGVPYVTVNCNDPGHHESAPGHNALSVHAGTPTLEVITESLRLKSAPT